MKLLGKIFINGNIVLKTGLHIGGSSSALDIGGIDSAVIKNAKGVPYIPGSSIKGKMRALLELKYSEYTQTTGKVDDGRNDGNGKSNPEIQNIFGTVSNTGTITRLIVRDAFLSQETMQSMENREEEFKDIELDYTEGKWENTIDRLTSEANPRQLERVPAGAVFRFSMVFNIMKENDKELLKKVVEGMALLEDDYIGGSGTRGYGQIAFTDLDISIKNADNYENNKPANELISSISMLSELEIDELSGKINL